MSTATLHPVANLFPEMSPDEFKGLLDDIRENGQREPIVYWKQQLVDGRHRLRACETLGIEPEACELEDETDPVAWAMSANLHRRQLTATQRAMVAAKLKSLYAEAAAERMKSGKSQPDDPSANLHKGRASDQAGAVLGVSARSVDYAAKVLEKGVPKLVELVEAGEVSVSVAATLADAPKKTQQNAVDGGKRSVQRAAGRVRSRQQNGAQQTAAPSEQDPLRRTAQFGVDHSYRSYFPLKGKYESWHDAANETIAGDEDATEQELRAIAYEGREWGKLFADGHRHMDSLDSSGGDPVENVVDAFNEVPDDGKPEAVRKAVARTMNDCEQTFEAIKAQFEAWLEGSREALESVTGFEAIRELHSQASDWQIWINTMAEEPSCSMGGQQ